MSRSTPRSRSLPTEERGFTIAVELAVTLPSVDRRRAGRRARPRGARVCPYSNATRGNIDVTLTANGQPVA